MKKASYILVLFSLINSFVFSQNNISDTCGGIFIENELKSTNCSKNSQDFINTYRLQSSYTPKANGYVDEIIIPINIIVLADDYGKHGAYKDLEALDNEEFKEDWLNRAFQKTSLPSDPNPGYDSTYWLKTTEVKFEINEVYFYDSTEFFNTEVYGDFTGRTKILNHHFLNNPDAKEFVNCFIVNNISAGGFASSYNGIPYIMSTGRKEGNMDENTTWIGRYWYWGLHLPHEVGHILKLCHTYSGSNCTESMSDIDYLSDVFFTPNHYEQPCPISNNEKDPWLYQNDFCTNNLMSGNPESFFISPLQAGRMHRSLRLENIRNFAYGYSLKKHYISQHEVWDFTYKSYNDIVIKSGASLTINCKLEMVSESRIIVEKGGKLILDGGIITSAKSSGKYNNDFWQGIQVYGTINKNQFPESNPTHQGLLIIKNGGTIENAHLAVSNWKEDDFSSIGGVIQATDAIFRNNRRDVAFMSYQNYSTSYTSKYRNLSYFRNTDFITDDNFIEKGLAIQSHVTMWKVDGITFTNCHFSNEITSNKNNSTAPNRGIYSIDAGYKVLAGCTTTQPIGQQCPTANLLKSSFSGLGTAIEATGASTSETVVIQQATFEDNVWGVVIDELDNVSVNRNDIEVGDANYTLFLPLGVGVMVSNSTGYIVEENEITTSLTGGMRVGINVNNSGTDDNEIYKNKLNTLDVGVAGNGLNHDGNYQKGLQFLCNDFLGNGTAISINSSPINDGVRFYQGNFSPLKSAGNIFMTNTLDIDNSANSIVYIHNGGNTEPINYQGMVTFQDTLIANSCPTSFKDGIIMKPVLLVLDSLNAELGELITSYNNLNFAYTSLIDDGNTEEFKDNIELNWSSDAWLLRDKLLASSPYLSSDVLLKAAGENVLPNGMLLEVLLANPDATKGERFIDKLKDETNNSFPEYMTDYVRGNYDSRTLRTDMEGQLSAIHSDLSNVRSWVKNLTKTKEEYTDEDRYNVAKLGNEIYNKVGLMDYYIEQGSFGQADSVLNVIENDKKYKGDLLLIENFGSYINFRSSLGNRNLAQLDSTEISYLQTLAENKGRVAGYAQNILCFFYGICYEKELAFENSQAKSIMAPTQNNKEDLNDVLYNVKLYPNPAKDYTSIQWEIYDELKNARYSVVDLNGRELLKGVLSDNKGEQVINTRKLGQGVYIIGIYNNNEMKVNRKLIVENRR